MSKALAMKQTLGLATQKATRMLFQEIKVENTQKVLVILLQPLMLVMSKELVMQCLLERLMPKVKEL